MQEEAHNEIVLEKGMIYEKLTLLREFKNATFYVDRFLHIAGLTLSTLSSISAHHREQ